MVVTRDVITIFGERVGGFVIKSANNQLDSSVNDLIFQLHILHQINMIYPN